MISYQPTFFVIRCTEANPSSLEKELQRLPKSLAESLEALNKDDVFMDFLGEKLLTAVEGVRKVSLYQMLYFTVIILHFTISLKYIVAS